MISFLKTVVRIKMNAALGFVAFVVIVLGISLFTGNNPIPVALLWQGIGISMITAVAQWLCFSEDIFKRLKYVYRNIVFILIYLPTLVIFAYFGRWFDMGRFYSWAIFFAIFILVFIGISIGFAIYFRITGEKCNEKLEQYKGNRNL